MLYDVKTRVKHSWSLLRLPMALIKSKLKGENSAPLGCNEGSNNTTVEDNVKKITKKRYE